MSKITQEECLNKLKKAFQMLQDMQDVDEFYSIGVLVGVAMGSIDDVVKSMEQEQNNTEA